MPTFPVKLPFYSFGNTTAQPEVQSASRTTCLARASFKPNTYRYITVVRLDNGEWSVSTTSDDVDQRSDPSRAYAVSRGHEIGLEVINWWLKRYGQRPVQNLPADIVDLRSTWLNRATHKLLTEVGELPEQIGALQLFAKNYGVSTGIPGAPVTMKGATWATAALRNLERDLPVEYHRAAVALLVDLVTGYRNPANEDEDDVTPPTRTGIGRVLFEDRLWTVRRQSSIAAGARADGEAPPVAPPSGVVISIEKHAGIQLASDKKERFFLPIPGDKLPTDSELAQLNPDTFSKWLVQARGK